VQNAAHNSKDVRKEHQTQTNHRYYQLT